MALKGKLVKLETQLEAVLPPSPLRKRTQKQTSGKL